MSESSVPVPTSIPEPLLSECRAYVAQGDPILAVKLVRETYRIGLVDAVRLLESSLGRKLGTRLGHQPDGSVVVSWASAVLPPVAELVDIPILSAGSYDIHAAHIQGQPPVVSVERSPDPDGFTVPSAPARPGVAHFDDWFDRVTVQLGEPESGKEHQPSRQNIDGFKVTHASLNRDGTIGLGGYISRPSEPDAFGTAFSSGTKIQQEILGRIDASPMMGSSADATLRSPEDITTDTPAPERLLGWLPEGWRVHKITNHFYGPNGEQVFNHGHGHVVAWGSKHEGIEAWTEWTECEKQALVLALANPEAHLDASDALQAVLSNLGLSERYAELWSRYKGAAEPELMTTIETIREALSLGASFRRVLDVLPDSIRTVVDRMPEVINAVAKLVEEKGGQPVYQDSRVAKLQARIQELEAKLQELENGKNEGQA